MHPPPLYPESIRAYLDAGGDVTKLPWWSLLAEAVVNRRTDVEDQRVSLVERIKVVLDDVSCGELLGATPGEVLAGLRRQLDYELELLSDPQLAERFEDALPFEEFMLHLHCVVETLYDIPGDLG